MHIDLCADMWYYFMNKEAYYMELIQAIDDAITYFMQDHLHNHFTETIMPLITHLGTGGVIWIISSLLLMIKRKTRPVGVLMLLSLGIAAVVGNLMLKPMFSRVRPYLAHDDLILLIGAPMGTSFPSGHSISSFATATALFMKKRVLGVIALVIAFMIAFSRVFLFVHYFTDVLVGSLLGVVTAILVVKLLDKRITSLLDKIPPRISADKQQA